MGGAAVSELFLCRVEHDGSAGSCGLAGYGDFLKLHLADADSHHVDECAPCRSAPTAGSGSPRHGAPGAGADDHAENVLALPVYSIDDHSGVWITRTQQHQAGDRFRLDDVARSRGDVCRVLSFVSLVACRFGSGTKRGKRISSRTQIYGNAVTDYGATGPSCHHDIASSGDPGRDRDYPS